MLLIQNAQVLDPYTGLDARLDLLIGDPEGWPHPVVWIGRYISQAEKRLRARGGNLRKSAIWLTASTVFSQLSSMPSP